MLPLRQFCLLPVLRGFFGISAEQNIADPFVSIFPPLSDPFSSLPNTSPSSAQDSATAPPPPPPRPTPPPTHSPPPPRLSSQRPPTSHPNPSAPPRSAQSNTSSERSTPASSLSPATVQLASSTTGIPSPSSPAPDTSPANPSTSTISAAKGSKHTSVLVGVLVSLLIILIITAILIHRWRRRRRRLHSHRVFDAAEADSHVTLRDATSNMDSRDNLLGPNNSDVRPSGQSEKNVTSQSRPQFTQTDPYDTTPNENGYSLSRAPTFVSGDWPATPLPRYTRPLPKIPLT
ncbi:hypothetical protein B0H14DRAFT_2628972 [Mycena olivaceomarginata]|nr:hypothetical protein B0H14DRAFT_2628972 [Mycena olivaceomarginata]